MLEVSIPALFLLFTSITSFSLYLTFLKLYPKNKFSLFFWIHLFSYAFFTIFVIVYEFYIKNQHIQALHEFVTTITLTNLPFYIIEAFITIFSIILIKELMSMSAPGVVIAFIQINVLFSAIGFYLLGDETAFNSLLGLTFIFVGAIIAGMKKLSFNIFENYDLRLLKLGTAYAGLQTSRILITYLCTAKMNPTTHEILQTLTKHLHIIPFAPLAPLHFNIGVQCIIVVFLFIYTTYYLNKPKSIINGFKLHYKIILLLSVLFTAFCFLYLKVFGMIGNKDIIVGSMKLYVPLTIIFGYLFFQQKPSKQVIIGTIFIICGSMFTIFI